MSSKMMYNQSGLKTFSYKGWNPLTFSVSVESGVTIYRLSQREEWTGVCYSERKTNYYCWETELFLHNGTSKLNLVVRNRDQLSLKEITWTFKNIRIMKTTKTHLKVVILNVKLVMLQSLIWILTSWVWCFCIWSRKRKKESFIIGPYLPAVDDFLIEDTKLVTDSISVRRKPQGGHGVQETSCGEHKQESVSWKTSVRIQPNTHQQGGPGLRFLSRRLPRCPAVPPCPDPAEEQHIVTAEPGTLLPWHYYPGRALSIVQVYMVHKKILQDH